MIVGIVEFLPLFAFAAGFLVSAWLFERATLLLRSDQKAQVVDAFLPARKLHILAIVFVIALNFWRPGLGWPVFAAYFVAASVWGLWRLRSLNLPKPAFHRYAAGQISIAGGAVLCAALALR